MTHNPSSDHARIKVLEDQLASLSQELERIKGENAHLQAEATENCECRHRQALEAWREWAYEETDDYHSPDAVLQRSISQDINAEYERANQAEQSLETVKGEREQVRAAYEESATFLSQANDELHALAVAYERVRAGIKSIADAWGQTGDAMCPVALRPPTSGWTQQQTLERVIGATKIDAAAQLRELLAESATPPSAGATKVEGSQEADAQNEYLRGLRAARSAIEPYTNGPKDAVCDCGLESALLMAERQEPPPYVWDAAARMFRDDAVVGVEIYGGQTLVYRITREMFEKRRNRWSDASGSPALLRERPQERERIVHDDETNDLTR